MRSDIVEPFPRERALAHASDGDDVKDARLINIRVGFGYPIGQQIQLEAGKNYLPKPYSFGDLATLIRQELDTRAQPPAVQLRA